MIVHQVFTGFIILYYNDLEDSHMREQQIMYNLKKTLFTSQYSG